MGGADLKARGGLMGGPASLCGDVVGRVVAGLIVGVEPGATEGFLQLWSLGLGLEIRLVWVRVRVMRMNVSVGVEVRV